MLITLLTLSWLSHSVVTRQVILLSPRGGSNIIALQHYCKILQYFGIVTPQSITISIAKSQSIAMLIVKHESIAKSITKFKSIATFCVAEKISAVVFFTEF